ncbi:18505_t:CDS:2, partial [Racocetra persica]
GELHLPAQQIINFRGFFPNHYLPLVQENLTISQFPLTNIHFRKPALFTLLDMEKMREKAENRKKMLTPQLPDDIKYSFADVGGYRKAKEELAATASAIKRKPHMKVPCGFILYGPPGTGKTMLAKAFAKEANLPFFMAAGKNLAGDNFVQQEVMG